MSTREPSGESILAVARITGADRGIRHDLRDVEHLAGCLQRRESIRGPRVGDVIEFADGKVGRFTRHWGDAIQTTVRPNPKGYQFGEGSFHLCWDGGLSYSGALDPAIPLARIVDTGTEATRQVWFFHHDSPRAHSAVYALIPCRVYRELPGETQ